MFRELFLNAIVSYQKSAMKEIMQFLSELRDNNSRDWFHVNRARYESCRDAYLETVDAIIAGICSFDPRLAGLGSKDCLFRINRDIRFSKDKSPYKTHFGAYMARGGRKSPDAGYYMHVSPDEVFIAAGAYSPQKENLKVIRQEIMYRPQRYVEITEALREGGYVPMTDERLKTAPKDFPKDSPYIDLVRDKHYIFSIVLEESEIRSPELQAVVISHFKKMHPYVEFLNHAMEFTGNE